VLHSKGFAISVYDANSGEFFLYMYGYFGRATSDGTGGLVHGWDCHATKPLELLELLHIRLRFSRAFFKFRNKKIATIVDKRFFWVWHI